jgi:hypothetical protein
MTVPYTFGTATTSIPLSNLDANFNTPITLGNTAIYLGNTTTTIGNLTLTNATISSGTVNITNVTVTTANVTNITVSGTTTLSGLTASTALALDASKNVVSVTNTGTENNVLSASPTLTGTIAGASLSLSSLTSGRVTFAGASGLLSDSANFIYDANGNLIVGGTTAANSASGRGNITLNGTASAIIDFTQSGVNKGFIFHDFTNIEIQNSVAGALLFSTNATEKMRLDSAGNLGLGVTPSAWGLFKAFEMPDGSYFSTYNFGGLYIGNNNYYNGANFIYKNTGAASLYTQGAGSHVFSTVPSGTGGTGITFLERMRITSAGDVGIGTSSPASKLHVNTTTGGVQVRATSDSDVSFFALSTAVDSAAFVSFANDARQWTMRVNGAESDQFQIRDSTAGANRLVIDSSGLVGIGTSSPATILNISSSGAKIRLADTGGSTCDWGSDATGTYWRDFGTDVFRWQRASGNESMRLNAGGALLVGTTIDNPGIGNTDTGVKAGGDLIAASRASNFAAFFNRNTDDGGVVWFGRQGANVGSISVTSSATAYNTSSDYRLKENIVPMTGALAKVAQLKPVTYKWKLNGSDGQGFIAHELAEVVPDCVTGEKDAVDEDGEPVYQGIDTSQLVATLVSAIQELKAEFDAYKATHP